MEHIVLGTSVVVKQEDAADRTEGGLYLPDESKVKPLRGTIMKMGTAFATQTGVIVKEGDRILFDRFAGVLIELDGEDYLVMDEEDILIVLKGAK